MPLLAPSIIFENAAAISPQYLAERGIRALILDVDNTLTAHDSQTVPEEIRAWLAEMRAAGIGMMIVSNNSPERVRPFARQVGLPFCANGAKPLPTGFRHARSKLGCKKSELALVGDQIFTDVLGANLYGVSALLVQPLYEDTNRLIRWKRKLEKPVLARYKKRGGAVIRKEETQHE